MTTPCQRLAICILNNGHDERCVVVGTAPTETPSLTTEQARPMPVLMSYRDRSSPLWDGAPTSVPWSVVVDHERQALANHSQTLARLAERGGLAPNELYAVVHDRPWTPAPLPQPELLAWLKSVGWPS